MPFPEIQSWLRKQWESRDSGEPVSLNLKTSSYIPGPYDWYVRNGFPEIYSALGGNPAWSGESVTRETALSHSVVWACYRLISESMGYLPASVKIKTGASKVDAVTHPMFSAMHNAPNEEVSAQTFKEMLTGHCMLGGDGYARIIRRSGTDVAIGLEPLLPERVRITRDNRKRLVYEILNERGIKDEDFTVQAGKPHDIFHLRGLSRDGMHGYNVLEMARHSIGSALAAERNTSRFWASGGRAPHAIEWEKKFAKEEDFAKFRVDYEAVTAEPHKTVILENGMKYKQVGLNMVDAQALETRQWNASELSRWWGISPHLVGDLSRATFSNIEQLFLEFKTICVSRWAKRWEQDFWRCVLTPGEKSEGYFLKINIDALLRADFAARMSGYASALQNGHKNIDEVRNLEDMDPLPDGAGQAYHIQLNMGSVGKDGEVQQPSSLVKLGPNGTTKAVSEVKAKTEPPPLPIPETHNHVTVNIDQPAQSFTYKGSDIQIPKAEPPKVDVHVEPPKVNVHVEPPNVHIDPTQVTVHPPDVNVNIEAPKAVKTKKTFQRNKEGQLVGMTEE